jgi:magnesium-transporting ATPase (P-type)
VLLLALALSYGVSDYVEGGVITFVVVANVLVGFYQEFQAEKKMDALRALSSPTATVLRNDNLESIPVIEIVLAILSSSIQATQFPAISSLFIA